MIGHIIAALEAGTPPWRRPWDPDKAGGPTMPRNAVTGKNYRGINVLTLGLSPLTFSSGDPRWATYRQAEERGWQVRRGEHGTTGYFFKRLELSDDSKAADDEDAVRRIPLLRAFTLFHASQIEGMPDYRPPTIAEAPWRAPEAAEIILANSRAVVRFGGERAFYAPATDHIQMPPQAAFASGDSRLMRQAGLESEIARLQRQRAAHVDDQHAVRRQIRDARLDLAQAEARIRATTADLARRQSTRGEPFTMEVEGRTLTQRKSAGAALLTKVWMAARERTPRTWTVGRIGGFELTCDVRPGGRDGGRHDARPVVELTLARTDFPQPVDLDSETTAIGIIVRLEHILDRMDDELAGQRRRLADASARLAGYEPRLGDGFPLQGELDVKLAQLAGIEADLARTESVGNGKRPTHPTAVEGSTSSR